MFAAEFEYYKARSVATAIRLLRAHQGSKLLAGGHSLIPLLKLRLARPAALIDIGGIEGLKGISVTGGGTDVRVRIGALNTHRAIAMSPELRSACPLLAEVAERIGDAQVRNRGTIGGNVAHADPASDWPTVLTALKASFIVQGHAGLLGRGVRTVPAAQFFTGVLTTSLGEHEVLTAVEVPALTPNDRGEYAKMRHPASAYSVIGAAAVITVRGGVCAAASIVVGGLVPKPVRATSVEHALVGQRLDLDSIAAAAAHVTDDLGDEILGDIYASAEYRKAVAPVEVKHALAHAAGLAHH